MNTWKKLRQHIGVKKDPTRHNSPPYENGENGESGSDAAGNALVMEDVPMPDLAELAQQLDLVLDDLNLPLVTQEHIRSMPSEQQWQMVQSHVSSTQNTQDNTTPVETHLQNIKTLLEDDSKEAVDERVALLKSLAVALRTQTMRYVLRFIELEGLTFLLDLLVTLNFEAKGTNEHRHIIQCIYALMNNAHGLRCVLSHPDSITIITRSIYCDNRPTKIMVLQILGAFCLIAEGHKKVLRAMTHLKDVIGERARFQTVVHELGRDSHLRTLDIEFNAAAMQLINATICAGPGMHSIEFRRHIRFEFVMLGILPLLERLRGFANEQLGNHLDIFEDVMLDDSDQFAAKLKITRHLDTSDAAALVQQLQQTYAQTPGHPYVTSILLHLLQVPGDHVSRPKRLRLLDELVSMVVLQQENGDNPDHEPMELSVSQIIKHFLAEDQIDAAKKDRNKALASKEEYKARCKKAEEKARDLKADKDAIKKQLNRKIAKLIKDKEKAKAHSAKLQEVHKEQVTDLNAQLAAARIEISRLQQVILTSDAQKTLPAPVTVSDVTAAAPPPPPLQTTSAASAPPPPAPPPPPGSNIPAPPPPPGAPGAPVLNIFTLPDPQVPKSSVQLKSFNWTKIPAVRLKGTLWTELKADAVYETMDSSEFDTLFSAYQRKTSDKDEGEDLELKQKPKELSVIDGRRAQNCTILLSKLRLTNREIHHAVLSMDEEVIIANDMVEQMLKFVPGAEEMSMLRQLQDQLDLFALSDRFLWEMSLIPRYEQRLKALHYKRKFDERIRFLRPQMRCVIDASEKLIGSKGLRQILEVVLALGNYMNRGNRGNAHGFKPNSLLKLTDTKSAKKRNFTLMNFLVQHIDEVGTFEACREVHDELAPVQLAAKVSAAELKKELANLTKGMQQIEEELDWHSKQEEMIEGDSFPDIMEDFVETSCELLEDTEKLFETMQEKFVGLVKSFAEDNKNTEVEDFFGVFGQFLGKIEEARRENLAFKRKEEEERRQKEAAEALAAQKAKRISANPESAKQDVVVDDLLSTLESGACFAPAAGRRRRRNKRSTVSETGC